MKVIGVGYPRTGTKTLGACFRAMGYRNASWHAELCSKYWDGNIEDPLRYAVGFDSFEDLPWCCLYRELDARFPGSKFILTIRKDERAWFESYRKHPARLDNGEYISSRGQCHEKLVKNYREHNACVRDYFRDRPSDLLEVCWEKSGTGWQELASFLNKPIPAIPFPHENKTPVRATLRFFQLYLRNALGLAN